MRVKVGDENCLDAVVIDQATGQQLNACIWADDDEGSYEEIVIGADGLPEVVGSNIVTRVVMKPIRIEIRRP